MEPEGLKLENEKTLANLTQRWALLFQLNDGKGIRLYKLYNDDRHRTGQKAKKHARLKNKKKQGPLFVARKILVQESENTDEKNKSEQGTGQPPSSSTIEENNPEENRGQKNSAKGRTGGREDRTTIPGTAK